MTDVERVDRSDMLLSRREIMGGSAVVAGAAVAGVMPRKVAAQQDPDNEISGTVTDAAGAVDGATVVAVPHDESLDPLVTTTDGNGDYIFDESALHFGDNLYHVIARDGTQADPRRGQQNYPFLLANGGGLLDSELDHRWRFDEGSGTTLSDSVGSVNATRSGSTWVSNSKYSGGFALDHDNTDDYWQTDSTFGVNGSQGTVMWWSDQITNNDDTGFGRFVGTNDDPNSTPQNGFTVLLAGSNTTTGYRVDHHSGSSVNTAISETTGPDASSQDLFFAYTYNGDSGRLRIWDSSGKQFDENGSGTRGTGDTVLTGMATGRYLGGIQDDVMVNTDTELSESVIESIRSETSNGRH